jgi:hypothetical protein
MMKIYGLVDLKSLFILDSFKSNFENAVNASYKASEDGALSIVIKGKLPDALKIRTYLNNKMDIPVGIFVNSKLQYKNALNNGISLIFSEREFPRAKEVLIPGNKNFLSMKGKNILIENRRLLKFFKETVDFLPEIVSAVSFRLSQLNYDCFITEEVLSAKKGLEISKYL